MHQGLRGSVRTSGCSAGVIVGWHALNGGWRTVEAMLVAVAATAGPGSVVWAGGDQMLVTGAAAPFVVVIGPGCTSAGPLLAAVAACTAFARAGRALRAATLAAIVLFVGNLVRMVAVVVIGARSGATQLELAHDGWATWWAVAVLLGAATIVARAIRDGHPAVAPESVVELATSR